MQQTIGDRIRIVRKEQKLTQPELAKRAGVSKGAISQWENDIVHPTGKNLYSLAEALITSPDFIMEGRGDYNEGTHGKENVSKIGKYNNTMPLISWVQAGDWCDSPDEFAPGDAEDWLPRPNNAGSRSFALKVEGDSMTSPYPGQRSYPHGTVIFVDPDRSVTNGARVVARTPDGGYTFKTYIEDGGKKYLKPINPTYDKFDITDDVHICGVVIGSYLPE